MLDLNKIIVDLQIGDLSESELIDLYECGYLNNDEMDYIDMTLQEIAPLVPLAVTGGIAAAKYAPKIAKLANNAGVRRTVGGLYNATKNKLGQWGNKIFGQKGTYRRGITVGAGVATGSDIAIDAGLNYAEAKLSK